MPKIPWPDPCPAGDNYGFLALLPLLAPSFGITERSGCRVKGLTLASYADVYVSAAFSRLTPKKVFLSHDEEDQGADQTGHPARHVWPRPGGLLRLCQSAGLSRLDPALSICRRSGCPSRPLQLRAPWHAYVRGAGKCFARDQRGGLRRRRPAAVRARGNLGRTPRDYPRW